MAPVRTASSQGPPAHIEVNVRSWTFGQKLGAGFGVIVCLTVIMGIVAIFALRSVVASKDAVIDQSNISLLATGKLNMAAEQSVSAARSYLLLRSDRFEAAMQEAQDDFREAATTLRESTTSDEARVLLSQVEAAQADHQRVQERVIASAKAGKDNNALQDLFEDQVIPARGLLGLKIQALVDLTGKELSAARTEASTTADAAVMFVVLIAIITVVLAILLAVLLTRGLTRQVGSAVQHVRSSSAELQAAAHQQASGAQEQSTAMSEISTTINELIATSRQIAESSQRVAEIAAQTASAARGGEQIVGIARESMGAIKRQVDIIVNHMLDLGAKSQQIGSILEIINELADQTNILAINASIEAAGAGESGRRFGVVADEIRKLADRVGGSTKEIRGLIDEVRTAVNTTVMATEGGSKSVDAGTRQFADVASSFGRIAELVVTTTDAAREIELSTKQQATAVEQVNVAISNVAQATRETEASSTQTHQTSVQLASLSRDLVRLIEPGASV